MTPSTHRTQLSYKLIFYKECLDLRGPFVCFFFSFFFFLKKIPVQLIFVTVFPYQTNDQPKPGTHSCGAKVSGQKTSRLDENVYFILTEHSEVCIF